MRLRIEFDTLNLTVIRIDWTKRQCWNWSLKYSLDKGGMTILFESQIRLLLPTRRTIPPLAYTGKQRSCLRLQRGLLGLGPKYTDWDASFRFLNLFVHDVPCTRPSQRVRRPSKESLRRLSLWGFVFGTLIKDVLNDWLTDFGENNFVHGEILLPWTII